MNRLHNFLFQQYLNEEEEIITVTHQNASIVIPDIIFDVIVWIVTPITLAYAKILTPYVWYALIPAPFIIIHRLYDWYGDAMIITNKGILNVEWNGIFENYSQRVNIADVSTVFIQKSGIGATVFQYGKLMINCQDGSMLSINAANKPERAQTLILRLREQYLEQELTTEGISVSDLKDMIKETTRKRRPTQAEKKGFVKYEMDEDIIGEET